MLTRVSGQASEVRTHCVVLATPPLKHLFLKAFSWLMTPIFNLSIDLSLPPPSLDRLTRWGLVFPSNASVNCISAQTPRHTNNSWVGNSFKAKEHLWWTKVKKTPANIYIYIWLHYNMTPSDQNNVYYFLKTKVIKNAPQAK